VGDPATGWVELDPRAALVWGPLLVAALLAWPVTWVWRAWRRAARPRARALATAVLATVLFVVAPAALALDTAATRYRVSATVVEVSWLGRVQSRLDFADLTRVEVGRRGSLGPLTPGRWEDYVRLTGRSAGGEEVVVLVTGARVRSLDPLVVALGPVLEDRPELTTTPGDVG
jgi:hypothetical protein